MLKRVCGDFVCVASSKTDFLCVSFKLTMICMGMINPDQRGSATEISYCKHSLLNMAVVGQNRHDATLLKGIYRGICRVFADFLLLQNLF